MRPMHLWQMHRDWCCCRRQKLLDARGLFDGLLHDMVCRPIPFFLAILEDGCVSTFQAHFMHSFVGHGVWKLESPGVRKSLTIIPFPFPFGLCNCLLFCHTCRLRSFAMNVFSSWVTRTLGLTPGGVSGTEMLPCSSQLTIVGRYPMNCGRNCSFLYLTTSGRSCPSM